MPLRLLKPYNGQAANTLYWGPGDELPRLRSLGVGDDNYELASDYQAGERDVTTSSVNVVAPATIYNMNSSSAQTVNLGTTGWLAKGSLLTFVQLGAGAFTIVPATGVSVVTAETSLVSKGQNRVGQLLKIGQNNWIAFGGFGG